MNNLKFSAKVVPGKGRGKELGFPTMNLAIPAHFKLKQGIYACWVVIGNKPDKRYMGALHYGPIPVFDEMQPSLEVYLLDYKENKKIDKLEISIVKHLREVRYFDSCENLIAQMEQDVAQTRSILRKKS